MNMAIKIHSCKLYNLFNTYLILSGREHIPSGCNTATETSVRKNVVHGWGSEQSVNIWYVFSWTCIPMLPWKREFAGLYSNFESISYSDILFRSLFLTIYTCIIISLVSQAETIWGFIFCFCKFCCLWKAVFPLSLIYNIILWERDEDRESLAILVFYANSQHISDVKDAETSWGNSVHQPKQTEVQVKPSLQLQPLLVSVNSSAALPSLAPLQGHKPQMTEAGVINGVDPFCRNRSTPPEATHTYS